MSKVAYLIMGIAIGSIMAYLIFGRQRSNIGMPHTPPIQLFGESIDLIR